jgi:CO dehydrogenase/acetyl-CoA synthase beta subunit
MGILDAAIDQIRDYINRHFQERPGSIFLNDGRVCSWPVGGRNNIVLAQDTGVELGNPRQESLSLILWTDVPSRISDARITVIGRDLQDARGKSLPFAKIVIASVHGFNEENTCDRWQEMDLLRFDIDLAGYMMRAVSQYQREWSRVSHDAIDKGFSFSILGSALMDKMKSREYIDGVEIIFVTQSPEAVRQLREVANGAMAIIGALNRMNEEIEADCPTCDYRVVCDTVDGLREMHAARKTT